MVAKNVEVNKGAGGRYNAEKQALGERLRANRDKTVDDLRKRLTILHNVEDEELQGWVTAHAAPVVKAAQEKVMDDFTGAAQAAEDLGKAGLMLDKKISTIDTKHASQLNKLSIVREKI